jgi:hypothetical protein
MPRLLMFCALITCAAAAACTRPQSTVRTFPDRCPPGWEFLYTDHDVSRGADLPAAVCRDESKENRD